MSRHAVAEIVATLALLGVTIGLSGGLALTYYSWLHSYSDQSALLDGQAAQLTSSRVYVVGAIAGSPGKVWLMNAGTASSNITQVYSDGSLLSASQWRVVDSVTGANASILLPGHLYQLLVNATSSVVVYLGNLVELEAGLGH